MNRLKPQETRLLVTDLMNERIDIPGVQEEVELMMFDGFTRFAAASNVNGLPNKILKYF